MSTTKEAITAYIEAVRALGDIIRMKGTIPSGHLYASVMQSLSLEHYNMMIDALCKAGIVKRHSSHLLEWIGNKDNQSAK